MSLLNQTIDWIQVAMALIYILFALVVLVMMWKTDLKNLICEPDGKASLSRFQLLLFTFVISGVFMSLSLEAGGFIMIPEEVLGLLGISGGSYLISKGISKNKSAPTETGSTTFDRDQKGE